GIRDFHVTGVQTCALPIFNAEGWSATGLRAVIAIALFLLLYYPLGMLIVNKVDDNLDFVPSTENGISGGSKTVGVMAGLIDRERSEERRVGKEWRGPWTS